MTGEQLPRCGPVGELIEPYDVDFALNGEVLVIDPGSSNIVVFSPDGTRALRSIAGARSKWSSKFKCPGALAVHGKQVFLLDFDGPCVYVYG